ncbi:AMP-binding protein [Actinophytocola oryzae]|uniref:Acyl-CoA synthetase (AMP-forming)/AMP-acid ligase II n=1 Tax=Actinophytocola oryzae TaxID=502181 RepID=A0A4R7UXJ5_9PSEU|nr:AMP-binding protein [Actinophytocola oryzae]TDV40762.1 acyl-CoA synthetase (AMP-forming)/AMP-acid ligase II [Actinophytocola oryzae]
MRGTTAFVDLAGVRPTVGARARAVAVALTRRGLTGHRVLVLLPPGADYVATLLGCFCAGVVAVPAPPRYGRRLTEIVDDARPAAAIGLPLTGVPTLSDLDGDPRDWVRPDIGPDTVALLQYASSGPVRGVMVSHANLTASASQLVAHLGMTENTSVVSYLPPYGELGLVGGVLAPLLTGARVTLLPSDTTPGEWLRMVSLRRAAISFAPDRAYAWHAAPSDLDLSHWDTAVAAAGPETLDRFANLLAPQGFRRESLFPAHWQPEATALVTGRRGLHTEAFGRQTHGSREVGLLSLGPAIAGTDLAVVDPVTATRCQDGTAGEVWVAGPNVAVGYLGRPGESERTFCARLHGSTDNYLRTGQYGILRDGALCLTEPQNVLLTR